MLLKLTHYVAPRFYHGTWTIFEQNDQSRTTFLGLSRLKIDTFRGVEQWNDFKLKLSRKTSTRS